MLVLTFGKLILHDFRKAMEPQSKTFTHLDSTTGYPAMVDVGDKKVTQRIAKAQSIVVLGAEIIQHFTEGDIQTKKGPVFHTAIIAGTMAAKKTSDLIPLCHPLPIENCKIEISINEQNDVVVLCTASVTSKTGVEMEALMGASVAALTIYDMCKAFSHDIVIKETRLIEKTGGKSDFRRGK
jgi:cyclic pyranopterin monophosphate synthase